MESILRPTDLACLNESAASSLGAGLATAARADLPLVRGFVVTPLVFAELLGISQVAAALDLYRNSAEEPEECWDAVKKAVTNARLPWAREMDILSAFGELDAVVSVTASTRVGPDRHNLYAAGGRDLLDAVKHAWLRWLKANLGNLDREHMPSAVVREVPEAEVSVRIRRKGHGQGFRLKAVFGLPGGLDDPRISGDVHDLAPDGAVERSEVRAQEFQYVLGEQGPSRVPVDDEFRAEEKLPGDLAGRLKDMLDMMGRSPRMETMTVCFISSRPVVYGAVLAPADAGIRELPEKNRSLNLLARDAGGRPTPAPQPGPVTGTSIFLRVGVPEALGALPDTYADGVILSPGAADDGAAVGRAAEAARKVLGSARMVLEVRGQSMAGLGECLGAISDAGLEPGVLLPGIRDASELDSILSDIGDAADDLKAPPRIWLRVMYPSNLFFMEALAGRCDVLALDLDSLGRLMLGAGEGDAGGSWLNFSVSTLERAMERVIGSGPKDAEIAVLASDMVSMPGLLESLVRGGCRILCVGPEEIRTVRHITASVERRMLLESGGS